MNRRGLMLGAAGASALLLAGCLGGAKGEDFVGFWAREWTHNGVTRMRAVMHIKRSSGTQFTVEKIRIPSMGSVRSRVLVFNYLAPNRLTIEVWGQTEIFDYRDGSVVAMNANEVYRPSTREEFDAFPAYAEEYLRRPRRSFF